MTIPAVLPLSTVARAVVVAAVILSMALATPSSADTRIRVGRSISANFYELPAYVAMEKGYFEREGLDAKFVPLTRRALVTSGIAGAIDFIPAPYYGAQAALKGAALRFVVGQATRSRWTIIASPSIRAPSDLGGKAVAFGGDGSVGDVDGKAALGRYFGLQSERDYRILAVPRQAERIAAVMKGDAHGAVVSIRYAAKAGVVDLPILIPSESNVPKLSGAFWVRQEYLEQNRSVVEGFVRAIANATRFLAINDKGSIEVIQKYFGVVGTEEALRFWYAARDHFSPKIPKPLLKAVFAEQRAAMISKGLWLKSRPLPDIEQFVARALLTKTLSEMGFNLDSADR